MIDVYEELTRAMTAVNAEAEDSARRGGHRCVSSGNAMTNKTKIVFIGATSMSFGLSMLRDIFSSDELRGSTLTLVGRNRADARENDGARHAC